ncbi:hypothetical protein ABK040_005273 [Willaertia magna]
MKQLFKKCGNIKLISSTHFKLFNSSRSTSKQCFSTCISFRIPNDDSSQIETSDITSNTDSNKLSTRELHLQIKKENEAMLKKKEEIMSTLEFYKSMTRKEGSTLASDKQKSPLFEVYREVKLFLSNHEINRKHYFVLASTLLNNLIETISHLGDVETSRTLLQLLLIRVDGCPKLGISPEVFVRKLKLGPKCTKLVKVIVDSGDIQAGIKFLQSSKNEKGFTAPYVETPAFTVVLNGIIKQQKLHKPQCEENVNIMKRAMQLFNWMIESDEVLVSPDEFTFATIIKGYCNIRDMGMALDLYNQMSTEYGIKPGATSKKTMIDGFIREGNVDKAYEFFLENCKGERYDDYYCALITGFTQENQLDKAYNLLGEMKQKDMKPSIEAYNAFLLGIVRSKMYDQSDVTQILKHIESLNLTPNSKTHGLVIKSLIQHGKLDEAMEYYFQFRDSIYGAKFIIVSLIKTGRVDEAEALLTEICENYSAKYGIDKTGMRSILENIISLLIKTQNIKKATKWKKILVSQFTSGVNAL